MRLRHRIAESAGLALLLAITVGVAGLASHAQDLTNSPLASPLPGLWKAGIGQGFNRDTHELELLAGGGIGMQVLGSENTHNWVLGSFQFGWVFSDVLAEDHWYRGNWEL